MNDLYRYEAQTAKLGQYVDTRSIVECNAEAVKHAQLIFKCHCGKGE